MCVFLLKSYRSVQNILVKYCDAQTIYRYLINITIDFDRFVGTVNYIYELC